MHNTLDDKLIHSSVSVVLQKVETPLLVIATDHLKATYKWEKATIYRSMKSN